MPTTAKTQAFLIQGRRAARALLIIILCLATLISTPVHELVTTSTADARAATTVTSQHRTLTHHHERGGAHAQDHVHHALLLKQFVLSQQEGQSTKFISNADQLSDRIPPAPFRPPIAS